MARRWTDRERAVVFALRDELAGRVSGREPFEVGGRRVRADTWWRLIERGLVEPVGGRMERNESGLLEWVEVDVYALTNTGWAVNWNGE